MPEDIINSIGITLFGSFLTFMVAVFWHSRAAAVKRAEVLAAENLEVLKRIKELEDKERLSSQVVTPIVTAFQALLIKQLTHAGKPEMDLLLVKVGPPNILSPDENKRLVVMLRDRTTDMGVEITSDERDTAVIFPIVMKMADKEQMNLSHVEGATDLKLMTIVSIVGATPKE